nr:reverse transcriptase domain-containing protein [Tanacetum cinerariifolium]
MNEASTKAMQTQIDMVKNELRNEMKSSIQTSLSNQTNEIKNMRASLLPMNTASTSGSGSLPSNTVANPKGEFKAITTRSGLVINEPTVPTPPQSINPEVDERIDETFTDPDLAEYTIKVPPPPIQKYKPPSQREFVVHKRDRLHPNIPYPSRMLKQKQQEKINGYPEKVTQKTWRPEKFLIPCGFNELKCKALANLGASINLMPLSVWKKLGLPELIPTRMTFELANRAICTPAGIARDVFVLVGKFTFPVDFVIVDYESDPRVLLILGRPFLRTARALIDVHGEEMILRDGDERLTLNMRHDTSNYSNQPQKESINLINIFNNSSEDFLEDLFPKGCNVLSEKLPDLDSTKDLHPPFHDNPLSGSTTYFSNPLLEEFADKLPSEYDDNLQFDMDIPRNVKTLAKGFCTQVFISSASIRESPMTSQYAFSLPDPTSFSTQQATFTSFSPVQTYNTSEPTKEYETWAMKMEYWIMNTDHNLWKIIQNGNSKKSIGRDSKGGIIILPPVSFEEHVVVQREIKARTLLLYSLPEDHMADFHHMDDAREIWLAVKARFGDFTNQAGNAAGSVSDAAAESAMMGISSKIQTCPFAKIGKEWEVKLVESLARFDKWKGSSKNLVKFINSSMSSRTKLGLGFKETIGSDEVWNEHEAENKTEEGEQVYGLMAGFKLDFTDHVGNAAGSVSDAAAEFAMMGISSKEVKLVESLARFDKWKESSKNLVKLINSFMSSRTKLGLGFKETIGSNEVFDLSTPSVFNPEPENREVKSLYERPKTNDSSSTIDVKILPKSDVKDPSPTNGIPSCSFSKNVKPPRNLCNKSGIADRIHCKNNLVCTKTCFVCGSKTHLIKDCDVYDNVPSIVSKATFVPAGSRNSPASISTSNSIPAASRNRPASIYAGRRIPAGRIYDHMSMNEGRWGSAVKYSAGYPKLDGFHFPSFWNEKWLVQGGTALELASLEQTATCKDVSNPFMAVMVCQKPLGYFSSPMIHVPRAGLVIHPPRLIRDQSSNPTPSTNTNPKGRTRRGSKQRVENFNLEEHSPSVVTMADQRTMAELLRAPTEGGSPPAAKKEPRVLLPLGRILFQNSSMNSFPLKNNKSPPRFFECSEISNFQQRFDESFHEAWDRYKDLLRACPHHGFTELHQLDTFYNALNPTDQDSLNAAGENLLEKSTQDVLTIIKNKSKVRNSRSKPIISQVKACDVNSNSEIAKLTHAVNQQMSAVTTAMTAMLKQFQATPPPVPVKAVEEICVTCGGAHPYYQCLAAGGNTFPKLRDNIQGYVLAAVVNYNQGNLDYRPQGIANKIRPPGFAQPNVQNN